MSLRYVFGIPGSGKTTQCINEVIKCANSGKKALYIVPEQFSLESERLITEKVGVLLNSEVVSFVHLAHRMLAYTGNLNTKILDDDSKILLLRKAAISAKDKLLVYKISAHRQGFLENISALISEFAGCGVPPQVVFEKADFFRQTNELLSRKLNDIALIYELFMSYIKDKYILKDTLLDTLTNAILSTNVFKNTEIWIDSFTDFTPQEIKVIGAFLKVCPQVTVSLALPDNHIPASPNPFNPLYELWRSVKAISTVADNQGVGIEKPFVLTEDIKHTNAPMLKAFTTEYLKGTPIQCQTGNDIRAFSASSLEEELEWCAQEIVSLISTKAYNYSDIGIMIGSESYYSYLDNIFAEYNLPVFTDIRSDILSHPLTVAICSFFKLLTKGWQSADFFALLHTGLMQIDENDICLAENFCIATGIKRIAPPKATDEEELWQYKPNYESDEAMEALNFTRKEMLSVAATIAELKKSRTVKEISSKVYSLLEELKITNRLTLWIGTAKQKGDEAEARYHLSVWNALSTVFSRMCSVMGDDKISLDEFYKLLLPCVQNATLGIIPPTCQCITVGEFNRSRMPDIKVLFMLGVNEGCVPPYHSDTNMLSDNDRALLSDAGCTLGGDTLRLITRDNYKTYACASKPSDRLYICYNTGLAEGVMSSFMQDIINDLKPPLGNAARDEDISSLFTDEQSYNMLLKHIKALAGKKEPALSPFYLAIYKHLKESPAYCARLNELKIWSDMTAENDNSLLESLAKELYLDENNSLQTGITSIEAFERCPFSFFMKNGLAAYDRNEFSMESYDYGTLFHQILTDFSDTALNLNVSWTELKNEGRLNELVEKTVEKITEEYKFGYFTANYTNKYIVKKIKQTACDVINSIAANESKIVPYGYEIPFGRVGESLPPLEYQLNDNVRLLLRGSIDKVETLADENGNHYVKITDYKNSSSTSFSPDDLFIGIKLQLPLYMQAFLNGNKGFKPGAFFYFGVNDPTFDAKKSARDLDSDIYNKLISGGVTTDDANFFSALNKAEQKKFDSANNGKSKNAKSRSFFTIPESRFNDLYSRINEIITNAGTDIIKGVIKPYPFKTDGRTACGGNNYSCEYNAICGFELKCGGEKKYRTISREKLDDSKKLLVNIENEVDNME